MEAGFTQTPLGASATLFYTRNGGRIWQSLTVTLDVGDGELSERGSIFFLDDTHGWLLAGLQTGSAASRAVLYGSSDSGRTWGKLSIPVAGHFRFHTASDGWVAG